MHTLTYGSENSALFPTTTALVILAMVLLPPRFDAATGEPTHDKDGAELEGKVGTCGCHLGIVCV